MSSEERCEEERKRYDEERNCRRLVCQWNLQSVRLQCQSVLKSTWAMYVARSGRVPSVKDKLEAIRSCPELIHVSDIIDSSFRISLQWQHHSLIWQNNWNHKDWIGPESVRKLLRSCKQHWFHASLVLWSSDFTYPFMLQTDVPEVDMGCFEPMWWTRTRPSYFLFQL